MNTRIGAATIAGVIAGVVMGVMMHMTMAPTPDGGRMPMMAMVAQILRSESLAVGWVYHLFNSAVIGAIFGWMFGAKVHGLGSALVWGAIYGLIWWVLGGLILMPLLLGMPAFAPLQMEPMRPVAMASLMGHLVYGLILGAVFSWLFRESRLMETHRPAGQAAR